MTGENSGMFCPLGGHMDNERVTNPSDEWQVVIPAPTDAPRPPAHNRLGKATAYFEYRDGADNVIGYVCRYDRAEGGKLFMPMTWCRHTDRKLTEWRFKSWSMPRPLYGLNWLAASCDAPVLVCEGEKAVDAASQLLPGYVVITSPGGSNAAHKADWQQLSGRQVTIWPDADEPGRKYADAVTKCLHKVGAASVSIINLPVGASESWDAADAMAEGWDEVRTAALVDDVNAAPDSEDPGDGSIKDAKDKSGRGSRQDKQLLTLLDEMVLWHDPRLRAFATVQRGDHFENYACRSTRFKQWLTGRTWTQFGFVARTSAIDDVLRVFEAIAVNEGPQHVPATRIGRDGDAIYIDLVDDTWRAVKITSTGWAVEDHPPVKFVRSSSMVSLPIPEAGYFIEELYGFLNIKNPVDLMLAIAWLVASLRDQGPYPILVLNGEQGSSKSTFSKIFRALVDPNEAPIRSCPREERDLFIAANNSWALAFDNLSSVAPWLSDGLCRISTGGGYATRRLHTDDQETVMTACRPIIINGIPDLASRPDLSQRALVITLPSIDEENRRSEDEFWKDFTQARPRILGALLDAMSAAIRNLPDVQLDRSPRMADFCKWICAASPGLGWSPDEFVQAYTDNQMGATYDLIDGDPVAQAILKLIEDKPEGWQGSATQLLDQLMNTISETIRKSRSWPNTPQKMGNAVVRLMPTLRTLGVIIQRRKSAEGGRVIKINRT